MIIFREKIFNCSIHNMTEFVHSRDEKYFENGPLNFIKAMEMWDFNDSMYVFHWISEMVIEKTILHIHKTFSSFTPQMAFIGVEDDSRERANILGENNNDEYEKSYDNPQGFCDGIMRRMLTEPHRGTNEPKYEIWFRHHPIKNPQKRTKEYDKALKYVALCMSGQLDPEVDGFEESTRDIYTLSVNYSKRNSWSYDRQKLTDRLMQCLKNILGKRWERNPEEYENLYNAEFNLKKRIK